MTTDPAEYYEPLTADDYYDDDDTPWADPAIRLAYEAALGEFIVTFNQLEDLVVRLVDYSCRMIKRPVPRSASSSYAGAVDLLEIMGGMQVLHLQGAPIAELRSIGKTRNFLVHGHFDQNPFDGSYVVSPVRAGKPDHVKPEAIRELSGRAMRAWETLRHSEAVFAFRDVKLPD